MEALDIDGEIPKIITQSESKMTKETYVETQYRWVIVALMGFSLLANGLANNAIIPLEHKMTVIYQVSDSKVSISIIISFLAFSLANFPANFIIDTKGLRISFLIGSGLYTFGTLLYSLINLSYNCVIIGTVLLGIGQPFLLNCPAKVAAYWFFPKNRAFATAVMIGINLFGLGIGFLIPALVVSEESIGEIAKQQIFHLYFSYFLICGLCFLLNFLLMKTQPQILPSSGAEAEKVSSPLQILAVLKNDRNLWKFYSAYFLVYGTFVAFASNVNFIIKPYGYSDLEIAIDAILLLLIGTAGAIIFSLYLKRTFNYSKAVRVISLGSIVTLLFLCFWLNTLNFKIMTALIISILGFLLTPVIPISYQLGCELAFPVGQAQITGLLNGGSFLWTFIVGSLVTSLFGFGNTIDSLIIMIVLSIFITFGCFLFFHIRMNLKRTQYEQQKKQENNVDINSPQKMRQEKQIENLQTNVATDRKYSILQEQPNCEVNSYE